jgi:hypothetical protein
MKQHKPYVDPGIQHHHDGTTITVLAVKCGNRVKVYAKTRKGA